MEQNRRRSRLCRNPSISPYGSDCCLRLPRKIVHCVCCVSRIFIHARAWTLFFARSPVCAGTQSCESWGLDPRNPDWSTSPGTSASPLASISSDCCPANKKAIQVAREMGDLSENFEYKSARQRDEYLSARAGKLLSELGNVRVLEPAQVDTSVVRVGTKVGLSNGDVRREVTILGPWESAPEHGVYSNESEVAKALIGHSVGEIVTFMGNDYQIEAIRRWNEQ